MPELPDPAPLTDAELKALAHPLRVRMLDALTTDGPATASQLAHRFGETSGATSYHLRQLNRHGFIEEDPDRGSGRERWWRILRRGWSLPSLEFQRHTSTRDHARVLLHEMQRGRLERWNTWLETFPAWDEAWAEASVDSSGRFKLTAEELTRLAEDLNQVILRYAALQDDRPPPPGSAVVEVQVYGFPLRLVDEDGETGPGERSGEQ